MTEQRPADLGAGQVSSLAMVLSEYLCINATRAKTLAIVIENLVLVHKADTIERITRALRHGE